jgi:16S rRNA processing protein RimM
VSSPDRSRRVELGRVVGAHALKGELRVRLFGDGPDHLLGLAGVWLGEGREDAGARHFAVTRAGTGRGGEVRLALEGVSTREEAAALRGLLVLARSSDLPPLDEGDFYWHELIGCMVETETGEPVGRVREMWETGAHDVLVVVRESGDQVLVPTAREIMLRVDVAAGRIVIDAIPGLLEA